jgi:hypothetical protein
MSPINHVIIEHKVKINPLALLLPGYFIKIHLPDPPPIDVIQAQVQKAVKGMAPAEKKVLQNKVKALKAYITAVEKVLR